MKIHKNIGKAISQQAAVFPHRDALILPYRNWYGKRIYKHYSYQYLDQLTEDLAKGILSAGLQPKDRCIIMLKPSLAFFTLTFALFKSGVIPVFIDPGMGFRKLKACLIRSRPVAFIGGNKAHLIRLIFGCPFFPKKLTLTVNSYFPSCLSLSSLKKIGQKVSGMTLPNIQGEDTAAILFTSGSTGKPKGAEYLHRHFMSQIESLKTNLAIRDGERDLCTFPLFALFAPALGMTAIVPDMNFIRPASVKLKAITDPLSQFQITNLFGSPALIKTLCGQMDLKKKLPYLKRVVTAGAPVSPKILAQFKNHLEDQCPIFTPYGATEALPIAITQSTEILEETYNATRTGAGICVGLPVPEIVVMIMKITDSPIKELLETDLLDTEEIGEIIVSGPQVTERYLNDKTSTDDNKIFDRIGSRLFHRMGDCGYLDHHGRLWFCGRKSQRVMVDEHTTLHTIACESVFNEHPLVNRTALVGLGSRPRQKPVLCIESEHRLTFAQKETILSAYRQKSSSIPKVKSIQSFLFYQGTFPVDIRHNAKIFRENLTAWAKTKKTSMS